MYLTQIERRVSLLLLALACGAQQSLPAQARPSSRLILGSYPLSRVEMRLERHGGDGCVGPCIGVRYWVSVRGDGTVQYEDVGTPSPMGVRTRTIPVDEVISLANAFFDADFVDAPEEFTPRRRVEREGDMLVLRGSTSIGRPMSDLTLRIGDWSKTVTLDDNRGYPMELNELAERLDGIGGPAVFPPSPTAR